MHNFLGPSDPKLTHSIPRRPKFNNIGSYNLVISSLTTRVRWFKNDGDLTLVAYDMAICKNGEATG